MATLDLPFLYAYPTETQVVISATAPMLYASDSSWRRLASCLVGGADLGQPRCSAYSVVPLWSLLEQQWQDAAARPALIADLSDAFGLRSDRWAPHWETWTSPCDPKGKPNPARIARVVDGLHETYDQARKACTQGTAADGPTALDRELKAAELLAQCVKTEIDLALEGSGGFVFVEAKVAAPLSKDRYLSVRQDVREALVCAMIERLLVGAEGSDHRGREIHLVFVGADANLQEYEIARDRFAIDPESWLWKRAGEILRRARRVEWSELANLYHDHLQDRQGSDPDWAAHLLGGGVQVWLSGPRRWQAVVSPLGQSGNR